MDQHFVVKEVELLDSLLHIEPSVVQAPVHPRFNPSYRQYISVPSSVEALLVRLGRFRQNNNLDTCFEMDLDILDHSEFIELVEIRSCFLAFANQVLHLDQCKQVVHLFFILMLVYKHMTFNNDYVPFDLYKRFVLKLLHFMSYKGCIYAFLVFCEVCPELVTEECYPKFHDTPCGNCVDVDPLYVELFYKHSPLWNKYIVPQLAHEEDTYIIIG